MFGNLPFWFYKWIVIIIKKGGKLLLLTIIALISQGVIKTVNDLKNYLKRR